MIASTRAARQSASPIIANLDRNGEYQAARLMLNDGLEYQPISSEESASVVREAVTSFDGITR